MTDRIFPAYIIAATPRSGSYLLCEALERTGVAGMPHEYAPVDESQSWRKHYGFASHLEYFYQFRKLCTTPNGITGCKLMWSQLAGLSTDVTRYVGMRRESDLERLEFFLGRVGFVRLVRRDRLRQAISLIRAMQTEVWSSRYATAEDSPLARYDREAITWALAKLSREYSLWQAFIANSGRPMIEIAYEDFSSDYRQGAAAVLEFLGFDSIKVSGLLPPQLRQQRDELTEKWVQRYRLETNACE